MTKAEMATADPASHNDGIDGGHGMDATADQDWAPHHGMSPGTYLATRFTSLAPPMRAAPNPFRLIMTLDRLNWACFFIAFWGWVSFPLLGRYLKLRAPPGLPISSPTRLPISNTGECAAQNDAEKYFWGGFSGSGAGVALQMLLGSLGRWTVHRGLA